MGQSQSAENQIGGSSRRRRRNSFSSGEQNGHQSNSKDNNNALDRHSDHVQRTRSRSEGNLISEKQSKTWKATVEQQNSQSLSKHNPAVDASTSPKQAKSPQLRRNMSSRIRRAIGRKRGSKRKSKQGESEPEETATTSKVNTINSRSQPSENPNLSEEEPPSLISMDDMPSNTRLSYVDDHGDSSDEDSEDSSVHSPSFASDRSSPPSLTDYASPPQQRHRTIELSTPSSHASTERETWGLPAPPISPHNRGWPRSRSRNNGVNSSLNRHQRHYEDSLAGSSIRSTDTATTAAAANHSNNHDSINLDQVGALPLETPPPLKDMNNASFDSTATPPIPPPPPLSSTQASPQHLPPTSQQQQQSLLQYSYNRRTSIESTISTDTDLSEAGPSRFNAVDTEFFPRVSRRNEWMGRSIESLVLGYISPAPILALEDGDDETVSSDQFLAFRRRSTASTFGGRELGRRMSQGSFPGGRRGSLSLMGNVHGGTLANYYSQRRRHQQHMNGADFVDRSYNERVGRRGSTTTTGPMFRRRSSMATTNSERSGSQNLDMEGNNGNNAASETANHGPNVIFSILARETTGKPSFGIGIAASQALRSVGGNSLFGMFDKPSAGMATEVRVLAAAISSGDWTETTAIISRLAPRLTGDPMTTIRPGEASRDANTPPQAPKFYAGGGRLGLERDAFCLAGGVEVMIRMFREKSFVGQEMSITYDARSLSQELVSNRLASCWNEALIALRELVYAVPSLVESGAVLGNGDFLPFLFTLLVHDSCFEAAAALIEEILSMMSQAPQQTSQMDGEDDIASYPYRPTGRITPASTFYLGNVPNVYSLWKRFNCRQLAHFCRILALLVFEPEDRQLLESPTVLKSIELLQLRRNRAVRAGKDSTVDMNQSIVLGDKDLLWRLILLLKSMNYAPPIRRVAPYHIMAHNPFVVDTLLMLGFNELETWEEIDRQDNLARDIQRQHNGNAANKPLMSRLGSIADWLEDLSQTLSEENEPSNQILRIMSSAQQAGLVVGSRNNRRSRYAPRNQANRSTSDESLQGEGNSEEEMLSSGGSAGADGAAIQGFASIAGMLTDQMLVRRLYQSVRDDSVDQIPEFIAGFVRPDERQAYQHPIQTASDAANNLQFNAMILGPYQVEVLFVLCTLLGGRRKLDAQDQLQKLGLIPVMEEMFERLPWFKLAEGDLDDNTANADSTHNHSGSQEGQPGIHGPGCECTPESALCVQYLRLLHNFCDRDCDNYGGRRLLLSDSERNLVLNSSGDDREQEPGLLTKIIGAFMGESDESPYRFWLASCIESYLRGSSPAEQLFVAKSGLLNYLVREVSSERLHCAGSLQTSFDLLGELGKGNSEVFRLLVSGLDEEEFRRLMGVAASNLVDSNVFIRSLLLSLERLSASNRLLPLYADQGNAHNGIALFDWSSMRGSHSHSYLTHSWWDAEPIPLGDVSDDEEDDTNVTSEDDRPVDWFPDLNIIRNRAYGGYGYHIDPVGLEESIGHYGWLFAPAGDIFAAETYLPSVERLYWFLAANQGRLLRDLLGVVDLRNINHENICCLNTAVVIAIFAHRRQQLASLLQDLKQLNDDEQESNRRASGAAQRDDVSQDRGFLESIRFVEPHGQGTYSRRASLSRGVTNQQTAIGDRTDILRNFREVLWFWREYYTHRGRDRLSLEFSSHLRFEEWDHVVSLLAADDSSPTSLVPGPTRLPRSPYQRSASARITENPMRAE